VADMTPDEWLGTAVVTALWGLLILSLWWRARTRRDARPTALAALWAQAGAAVQRFAAALDAVGRASGGRVTRWVARCCRLVILVVRARR
jgi:hypothetical protein